MWRLLGILALVICAEAMPKKYAGIPLRKPSGLKASDTDNRLNTTLAQPSNYKLDLTVTEDNLNNGDFSGTVEIKLNIGTNATDSFQIHAKELEIVGDITLTNTDFETNVTYDGPDSNDFLTINSSEPIPVGTDYVLTISYTGKLSDTDMEGFYRSSYTDDEGNTKYLATTQFEQMGARRAFPCFDEPALKATFDITITYPNTSIALSNTAQTADPTSDKDGLNKVTFKTTPLMSTYLVAFIVSEFECNDAETTDPVPSSVCARSGNTNTTKVALDTAPQALKEMNTYTKHAYKDLGNDKMTQVAIPDFAAGAMENWGLVTYREADLLWDETESSNYYKQAVVTVVSHELSHQWFGDYVTLDWWSNVFLNEGFATYFEYYAAANIQNTWELEKQFVIDQVQPVLVTDSDNDSLPLSYESNDPDVIESRFDDIAYNKGGSIIRMLQNFVGLENFEKGLSTYLDKGRIGTPNALWTSFNDFKSEDIPANVEVIMDNWTNKPGYPLLTLKQDGINVTITQERFLLSGEETDKTQWYVPITYTTSNDTTQFTETTTKVWLTPEENLTITLDNEDDWIILNNQQVGYYRVDYDDTLLEKIKTALNTDSFGNINEISRSQLVDDQLNLARAGKKEYKEVLEFLGFLKKDNSYYSWSSAFNGFSYLLKRTNDDTVKNFLKAYIIELMDALLKDVPVTSEKKDEQIYTLKQVLALTWACNLEHESCVNDARERFVNYTSTDNAPSSNLRSIVYCNGLRQSENASGEYGILLNRYTSTKLATEQVTILKALGCVNNASLRQEYLKEALGENVRLQDARYVFQSVYSNNGAEGVNDVVQFIADNYKDFESHFGSQSTLNSLIHTVADLFTSQEQIDKLNDFLGTEGLDASIKSSGDEAAASATNNLDAITSLEAKLKDYFKTDNGSAAMTTYHFVTLGLIGVVYLMFNF